MVKPVKLYFSYGMNTNPHEMAYRCPSSQAIGRVILPGHRLEFKTHATIAVDPTQNMQGVLWQITKTDEQMLDILEGFPEYYTKKMVTVHRDNVEYIAMTYVMDPRAQIRAPHSSYYNILSEGYEHFGLNQSQLLNALPTALTLTQKDFDYE